MTVNVFLTALKMCYDMLKCGYVFIKQFLLQSVGKSKDNKVTH